MEWILIGVVSGSLIVSGHSTEETCLGRKAALDKQKLPAICVKAPITVNLCGNNCVYVTPN